MTECVRKIVDGYQLGLANDVAPQALSQLLKLVNHPVAGARSLLGGRARVAVGEVQGIGQVVVKHYMRGGLLGKFVGRRYLRNGMTRCEGEFNLLQVARSAGISVPEPVAFISQGALWYRAWLVTKEIKDEQSLAELSLSDEEHARDFMEEVVKQVTLLIERGIWHVDLHPGNILIDSSSKVYLLDFDKARCVSQDRNELRDRYICRWRRAVIKHKLPEILSELMCLGLRRNAQEV